MSEERLTVLETKVDELAAGQAELRTEVVGLRTDVDGLRTDVDGLSTNVTDLNTNFVDLKRYMLVLHEETLETIKALAPDFGPIRREFRAADEALREDINRRLVPLEHAVREQARRKRRR
jgi:outer membrane murein-binding lipoprotein Lpp